MSRVRAPAVAGSFYESTPAELASSLRECFLHPLGPGSLPQAPSDGPGRISALVSPHAGYVYSGPAAANGFLALAEDGVPETIILLGPSHRTIERRAALSTADAWRTPLGEVKLDADLAETLLQNDLLVADESAHRAEHSLEVQVPFLQFIFGERMPTICPICVRAHPRRYREQVIADALALGGALAAAVGTRRAVVIASTDFSHQMPQRSAQRMDQLALDRILALDPAGLIEVVEREDISMCGPVPTAIAIAYCQSRGEHEAELLRHYTSGDIIGEMLAVVGYASVVIRRTSAAQEAASRAAQKGDST